MLVTINDVRRLGHCTRGLRRWAEANKFDFADFVLNGIESDVLLATGDALAVKVVARLQEFPHG